MKHLFMFRSPPELVKEIILVDDASQLEHLKDQLEQYIKRWSKVSWNPKSIVLKQEKTQGVVFKTRRYYPFSYASWRRRNIGMDVYGMH
jgi:hypothetical protein